MSLKAEAKHRPLVTGSFEMTLVEGGLGAVFWNGVEVLRGVSCLVRDADWGTYGAENFVETRITNASVQTIRQTFTINKGTANVEVEVTVDLAGQLELIAKITANADVMTNRAGLVILHPIAETAGCELNIAHPDGSATTTQFPKLIAPSQPAMNIAGLNHTIGSVNIDLLFAGDVFEMEDQRNWSDASFKTYCRPLSRPYPYALKTGETVRQTLRLTVKETAGNNAMAVAAKTTIGTMPEIMLALEQGWMPDQQVWPILKALGVQGLLLRVHATEFETSIWQHAAEFAAAISAPIDLELVLTSRDFAVDLHRAATHCAASGIAPRHVFALPDIWLKSYQPDLGPLPASLKTCITDARSAFPNARIGAGMLTNFTELNRCRVTGGDYVTHGNTAIVHAADDVSVWQTLEALPQIFASGKAIAGQRGYRLGLVSIGMRTNPYGAALATNPDRQRVAMAGDDPRQQEPFAAAYAIGAAIEAAFNGVGALGLAAPVGRFGIVDASGTFPIFEALQALAKFSGQKVKRLEGLPVGLTGIEAESGAHLIANCSPQPVYFSGQSLETGACLMNGVRLC